jgi:hypothetical protein
MRTAQICFVATLLALILAVLWSLNRPSETSHEYGHPYNDSAAVEATDTAPSLAEHAEDDDGLHDVKLLDEEQKALESDKRDNDQLRLIEQSAEGARPLYHERETSDVLRMLLTTRLGHEDGLAYIQGLADREEIEGGLDLSEMAKLMDSLQLLDDKGVFSSGASAELKNLRCTTSICQFSVERENFRQSPFTNAWRSEEGIGAMDFPQFYGMRDVGNPDIWHIYLARPAIEQYRDEILERMSKPAPGN